MSEDRPQEPPNPWATAAPTNQPTTPIPYGGQYGPPPAAPGYPPNPASAAARSSATLWLILNIVSVVVLANLPGIVGAIYAALALGRADLDPADARHKVRVSKLWFFAGLIFAVLLIAGLIIALVVFAGSGWSDGATYRTWRA